MAVNISKPNQFAQACKMAAIDKQENIRIRYLHSKQQLEFVSGSRNGQLFSRGTLYTTDSQIAGTILS